MEISRGSGSAAPTASYRADTARKLVLRPPQALRLVGAVGCRNGPVRPGQPALCWLVLRPLLRWPDRQQAALAFDHDIAGIGCGRRDQRDPAAAVMDDLVAKIGRASCRERVEIGVVAVWVEKRD